MEKTSDLVQGQQKGTQFFQEGAGFLQITVRGIRRVGASEVKHKARCREQRANTAGSGPPMLMLGNKSLHL